MGNRQTTFLRHQLDSEIPKDYVFNKTPVQFFIKGYDIPITYDPSSRQFLREEPSFPGKYNLEFKSHMRDFEVIFDTSTMNSDKHRSELKIARGRGIGVVIDYSRNIYIKIFHDKLNKAGYDFFSTSWATEDTRWDVLSSDLAIGYDVFIIHFNGTTSQYCEEINDEDQKPTPIIFKSCERYAKYFDESYSISSEEDQGD